MAKVTGPLLSLRAQGQIGKSQVYASWRGVPYARQHVIPSNPQSSKQTDVRGCFSSIQDLWKRLGTIAQAPWTSFSSGKPLTNRNAFSKFNVKAMQQQADRQDFVGSPGSKGGVAPTAVVGAGGAGSGEVKATITSPPTPTGWTLVAAQAFALEDGDPATSVPSPIGENENTSPTEDGDTDVTISGLTPTTGYVVAGWLKWTKPDGTTAYGASIAATATATT
jgi:hypothetical protein